MADVAHVLHFSHEALMGMDSVELLQWHQQAVRISKLASGPGGA